MLVDPTQEAEPHLLECPHLPLPWVSNTELPCRDRSAVLILQGPGNMRVLGAGRKGKSP